MFCRYARGLGIHLAAGQGTARRLTLTFLDKEVNASQAASVWVRAITTFSHNPR